MADIVTDISVNKNWNARKGANNPVTFTFTQSSAAFNISTYTFSIQLRKFGSDTNLLNLTQGSGITNNGAAGTLNVVITSANLSTFTADDYYWQMTVVHPDTFSYLWFQGTFNLFSETYTGDLTTSVNEEIDVNGTTINVAITLGWSGDGTALTDGNGTTANGTAVDLGGTQSGNISILPDGNYTRSFQIGDATHNLLALTFYADATHYGAFTYEGQAQYNAGINVAGDDTENLTAGFSDGVDQTTFNVQHDQILIDHRTGRSILFNNTGLQLTLGSDANQDLFKRNSAGYLERIPLGSNGDVLTNVAGSVGWAAPSGGSGLTVGTSTITSGTNTRVLYNNAGTLGEYTVSGSGNVAMTTSPTFTTPNIGTATGTASGNWFGTGTTTLSGAVSIVGTTTNTQTHSFSSLGTTATNVYNLINTTAAAAGAQQISPPFLRRGNGWKTTATAASQTVDFIDYVTPVQGTTSPTGYWSMYTSINGAANSEVASPADEVGKPPNKTLPLLACIA